ncbi:MAG: dihydroxy-acid dehydratase, partial [Caulobacteraceae bacterium]|nr:dihydroxy-acid dehydratase [Caulobacter sp.]
MADLHPVLAEVTERIRERSRDTRADYLRRMGEARDAGPARSHLSCGNLAHGFAAAPLGDKLRLKTEEAVNVGIVTAYNDMLSAHQPFGTYPDLIKAAARALGATAQVAGGVPAMCDGVTQGRPGMELSLFSRDVIAMATAIALTHDMFDAALMLGVCDKIVPGLVMGAAAFGWLPTIFVPAGPMPSGISNKEKARIRELFAKGEVDRRVLLESEAASYHTAGTCTFYGTANSNQMLMEIMGLHLPGSAFVNPDAALRPALTRAAARQAVENARAGRGRFMDVVDERALV